MSAASLECELAAMSAGQWVAQSVGMWDNDLVGLSADLSVDAMVDQLVAWSAVPSVGLLADALVVPSVGKSVVSWVARSAV